MILQVMIVSALAATASCYKIMNTAKQFQPENGKYLGIL